MFPIREKEIKDLISRLSADSFDNVSKFTRSIKGSKKIQNSKSRGDYASMNKKLMEVDWVDLFRTKDTNECYEYFVGKYNEMCQKFIPDKTKKINKDPQWLHLELKKRIRNKNKMWNKLLANRFRNKYLVDEYKRTKKMLDNEIRISIREYEKDLCMKAKNNPKLLFSYVKRRQFVKERIRTLQDKDGKVKEELNEICQVLNEQFKSVFVHENPNNIPILE
ncbi:RNA-directed DNA polymerase from mobile element jockey-like, partial [Brachionus plicatilis]